MPIATAPASSGPAYSLSADGQQRGDVNAADHAATLVIAKPGTG
jgi:hypothetical protein